MQAIGMRGRVFRYTFLSATSFSLLAAPVDPVFADDKVEKVLGGLAGGLLGRTIDNKGDRTLGTLLGVIGGVLVGKLIAKGLNKKDRGRLETSTRETIATGQSRTFNSESGVTARTELTKTDRRAGQVDIPVLKERVEQVPPLDFINAHYVALKKGKVLGGPGASYKAVSELKKGEVVTVTGKVQGQPWYLIAQNGVGVGFVPEKSLKATTAQPVQAATIAGKVEEKSVAVQRTCRTIKQTVVKDGKERSEEVTACQTADGWEVV